MLATTIKWNYNEVINNCAKMTTASKQLAGAHSKLKSSLAKLSTWEGKDATAFKDSMNKTILPALETEAKFMASVASTLKSMAEKAKAQEEARSRSSNLLQGIQAIKDRI